MSYNSQNSPKIPILLSHMACNINVSMWHFYTENCLFDDDDLGLLFENALSNLPECKLKSILKKDQDSQLKKLKRYVWCFAIIIDFD